MRLRAAAALLALAVTGAASAASPIDLAGSWTGTWANDGTGTSGSARLATAPALVLRLDGRAFGCFLPTLLPVRYANGQLTGSGRDVPCNRGLRWSLSGRFAGDAFSGTLGVRLRDGSRASLRIALQRSG